GTFVNGARIDRPVRVRTGDVIGLGSYTFTFTDTGELQRRDYRGNFTLEARDLGVRAGRRLLVANVDLTIHAGEFVGLMGPSGSPPRACPRAAGRRPPATPPPLPPPRPPPPPPPRPPCSPGGGPSPATTTSSARCSATCRPTTSCTAT